MDHDSWLEGVQNAIDAELDRVDADWRRGQLPAGCEKRDAELEALGRIALECHRDGYKDGIADATHPADLRIAKLEAEVERLRGENERLKSENEKLRDDVNHAWDHVRVARAGERAVRAASEVAAELGATEHEPEDAL